MFPRLVGLEAPDPSLAFEQLTSLTATARLEVATA
jgi:hypothetical protein